MQLLAQVEMAEQAHKLPSAVSGGQQQRVAIARALANDPPILIADEPTGNLDSKTANAVFQLFASLVAKGKTVVMVTHDSDLAKRVDRAVIVADGAIVNEYVAKALSTLSDRSAGAGDASARSAHLHSRRADHQPGRAGRPVLHHHQRPGRDSAAPAGWAGDCRHAQWAPASISARSACCAAARAPPPSAPAGEANVEVVALDRAEFSSLIADSEATKVAIDRVAQQRFVENSAAREREVAHA